MKIKESTIEIFNFVVFKSMSGTKITELAALRPLRGFRLTSYSSFNFHHLWLHLTYCLNMRSSYSRYLELTAWAICNFRVPGFVPVVRSEQSRDLKAWVTLPLKLPISFGFIWTIASKIYSACLNMNKKWREFG